MSSFQDRMAQREEYHLSSNISWISESLKYLKKVGACLHEMQFNISLRPALWRRTLCCYYIILKEAGPLLKAGSDSQLSPKRRHTVTIQSDVIPSSHPVGCGIIEIYIHPSICRHGVCSLLSCLLRALCYPQVQNGINSKIQAFNQKSFIVRAVTVTGCSTEI